MSSTTTISPDTPTEPGMNFSELRKEGIRHIQELAGSLWTDYNIHDPGVTILEQLCFAITDLSYRINYDIPDLLATDDGNAYKALFSPAQILTTNPVTLHDIRKVVIDVEGVKNAWVEMVDAPQPDFFFDRSDKTLTFTANPEEPPIRIKGLYRVLIEKEETTANSSGIMTAVRQRLMSVRNLCEDFDEIRILDSQLVGIKAEIGIGVVDDINGLSAEIYYRLNEFISPRVKFYNLRERLETGLRIDEVMDGPVLEHGFIDNEELHRFSRKTEIRASDLIRVIMDVEGVLAVKNISLLTGSTQVEDWVLELDPQKAPKFDIEACISNVVLVKDQLETLVDPERVKDLFYHLRDTARPKVLELHERDIVMPQPSSRNLSAYTSVQNQFPQTYGISDLGLPESASAKRKTQAQQLKGYLLFFEQILANYFAQVAHIKDLFSFDFKEARGYRSQSLLGKVPGIDKLLIDAQRYEERLVALTDNKGIALERRNRFLNHLLARFSEELTDYSLMLYGISQQSRWASDETLVRDKAAFLRDYPAISSIRGVGFDYTGLTWDSMNVAGLKVRLCRLLGIGEVRRTTLSNGTEEGFHLVEHILLRPRLQDVEQSAKFLLFSWPFSKAVKQGSATVFTCDNHGLEAGESIEILGTKSYNGTHEVTKVTTNTFRIEREFVEDETGNWVRSRLRKDPYSLQLTMVFPTWIGRFQNPTFQQLIAKTIRQETPAHLLVYVQWLNKADFAEFEDAYHTFLTKLTEL